MKIQKEHIYMGLGLFALVAMGSKKKSNGNGAQPAGEPGSNLQQGGAAPSGDQGLSKKTRSSSKDRPASGSKAKSAQKAAIAALNASIKNGNGSSIAAKDAMAAYLKVQPPDELDKESVKIQEFTVTLFKLSKIDVSMSRTPQELEAIIHDMIADISEEKETIKNLRASVVKSQDHPGTADNVGPIQNQIDAENKLLETEIADLTSMQKQLDLRRSAEELINKLNTIAK